MVQAIASLFETNNFIVYSVYGQVFFAMGLAVAFVAYAIVGGLVVPRLDLPPAAWLNYDLLTENLGVPAAVFRSVCGLAVAYFVVRSLQIFDVEYDRFLLAAERRQVLSAERERIGRDLHDGIVQSIYAAGLALEDASYTVPVDPAAAQAKIAGVMRSLNGIIGEIRSYIYNLSMAMDGHDLAAEAAMLVERLRVGNSFAVRFAVKGKEPPLRPEQRSHLLQILHEAVSNASPSTHGRARSWWRSSTAKTASSWRCGTTASASRRPTAGAMAAPATKGACANGPQDGRRRPFARAAARRSRFSHPMCSASPHGAEAKPSP